MNLDVPGTLTLDEPTLILEAARAGLGLAILSDWFVEQDVAEGRLVQVLKDWMPSFPGISLYYPANRHVPTALRLLIDLIMRSSRGERIEPSGAAAQDGSVRAAR